MVHSVLDIQRGLQRLMSAFEQFFKQRGCGHILKPLTLLLFLSVFVLAVAPARIVKMWRQLLVVPTKTAFRPSRRAKTISGGVALLISSMMTMSNGRAARSEYQ